MPTTIRSTDILFNDGTTQSTAAVATPSVIPAGTVMLFVQTAAPTGFTKSTTHNNKALRVVSGTASSGGSVAFTTAFASKAVAGTVGNHTLTIAQLPSHSHTYKMASNTNAGEFKAGFTRNNSTNANPPTSLVGGGNSHSHSFSGTAINLAVQYVDVIIAIKN